MKRRWSLLAIGLLLAAADSDESEAPRKLSGLEFVSPETRSLQEDDASNPGMLWVLRGEQMWEEPAGRSQASCASCHGEAPQSMRGTALRYPAFDAETERPIDLQTRINRCRAENQEAPAFTPESDELLALTTYVTHQSRDMSVPPATDERLHPFIAQGESLFRQRIGQLDLSCAACHDDRWGQRLGSSLIPQAHPTAYPLYRLEWQTLGSLQRRLRNCMIGVRAEPFPYGAAELIALELYLMRRAEGLPIETPGVRP
jgi:L-cysteine S-thiosulfotransferase